MKFIVYGKPGCGDCKRACDLLGSKHVEFEYIDLTQSEEAMEYVKSTGARTVPQIYENSNATSPVKVGGYQELIKYLREQNVS